MRVYHRATEVWAGGAWTYPVPTATVTVRFPGGAAIETLTGTYDATLHRLYFDSTNSWYVHHQLYQADWTITIGGVPYPSTDYYVHVNTLPTGLGGPGAPMMGTPIVSPFTVDFPFTPPSDPDYDHVTVYYWQVWGGTLLTATAAVSPALGTTSSATSYYGIGVAFDTSGNPSIPDAGCIVRFTTLPADMPDTPIIIKTLFNTRGAWSDRSPYYLDYKDGRMDGLSSFQIGGIAPMGCGGSMRLRIEVYHPIWPAIGGVLFRIESPDAPPFGIQGRRRTV